MKRTDQCGRTTPSIPYSSLFATRQITDLILWTHRNIPHHHYTQFTMIYTSRYDQKTV